jgi:hypothetical protein
MEALASDSFAWIDGRISKEAAIREARGMVEKRNFNKVFETTIGFEIRRVTGRSMHYDYIVEYREVPMEQQT